MSPLIEELVFYILSSSGIAFYAREIRKVPMCFAEQVIVSCIV